MLQRIGILLACILVFEFTHAAKPPRKLEADSIKKAAIIHRHALADSIKAHVTQVVFTPEYADSLSQQIEHLHGTLNKINNNSKYGFNTAQIEKKLNEMDQAIQIMSQSLGRDSVVLNINSLQMYLGLLKDMGEKLQDWRQQLLQNKKELTVMTAEMNEFITDSLTQKVAADTAFANLHLDEMLVLNDKWNQAQTLTSANLKRIIKLQAQASNSYFDVTELQNVIGNQLAGIGNKVMRKEYNYIWNIADRPSVEEVEYYTLQSFGERMSILAYYLKLNPEDWAFALVMGLIYFMWVFFNFRRLATTNTGGEGGRFGFKYLHPLPVLGTLILILNIAPFYGLDQPAVYVELIHIVMLLPLTILLWRLWPKNLFTDWCLLAALSLLSIIVNIIITPGWPLRIMLLGINVVSIILGWRFVATYNKNQLLGRPVKWISILYIALNATALFANVMGRLTLAKIFTSTAIIGLTQIIGLLVLVPMIIEAFYLQMKSRRASNGLDMQFNYDHISNDLYKILAVVSILCWLVTFATNLEIHHTLHFYISRVLNTPRIIGSTSFTIGNLITFGLFIYLASILQRYVGYFFGETEDDLVGDLDKKDSKLVLLRLAILIAGFIAAVFASGLPVDKVTVVLGALGVGIGLGLQNIVYNLISGVILIFEKPMQIGDYIEVAEKRGRVQSIGIRSSKLVTSDGSEVIVPNGDILSSHMVNWTRGNNHRRTELTIEIEPASELSKAKDTILTALKDNKHVIHELPAEILLNKLSEKSGTLTVNVWINSIYKEQEFKSDFLVHVYSLLADEGIKMV